MRISGFNLDEFVCLIKPFKVSKVCPMFMAKAGSFSSMAIAITRVLQPNLLWFRNVPGERIAVVNQSMSQLEQTGFCSEAKLA